MERRSCKLCFKSFANGKALGGHMRSHMLTHPTHPKTDSASSSSSSDEEEEEEKSQYYGLRENPKKSFRLLDLEFSLTVDAESVVPDTESETESSKSSLKPSKAESEQVSSVSDTILEEDVALCLMMLSRDKWIKEKEKEKEKEEEKSIHRFPTKARGKYQCGICKKVFRSYQALGGHKASHKKIKGCTSSSAIVVPTQELYECRRIHECPVCLRVFRSGQALGGHKRSHLSGSSAINSPKFRDKLLDLNLPAPVDDDDISHEVELSTVSDAEFVDPIRG